MPGQQRSNYLGLLVLVAANALAIWQFAVDGGSILQVLWIYWLQSVIIGAINVWRILSIPTRGNIGSPDLRSVIRLGMAGVFILHYGGFHLAYAFALHMLGKPQLVIDAFVKQFSHNPFVGSISIGWILLVGLLFTIHHVLTFLAERAQIRKHPSEAPSTQEIMSRPYKRILPMHLIIMFGPFIAAFFGNIMVFIVFMVLKSLADLGLYFRGTSHPGTINPAQMTAK